MADKFIAGAVHHPGRIREALGLSAGEKVTGAKLDGLVARLKKSGKYDKSWAGAVALARRFTSGDLSQ